MMGTGVGQNAGNAETVTDGAPVPPLVVEHVTKSYEVGGRIVPVIGDLSLTLREGEIVSIVGPSGCGKTTLLNTLSGLLTPDSGRIRWHGREVSGQPQNVGYMLQKDLLLPWRTALGNAMLGLEIRGVAPGEAQDRSHAMLDQLGLHGFADHYPSTLSGGMRQRVALARTLVHEPDVVSLADRVIVLSKRPTRVKAVYDIALGAERTDMIAMRQSQDFSQYVRRIWADLDVVLQ